MTFQRDLRRCEESRVCCRRYFHKSPDAEIKGDNRSVAGNPGAIINTSRRHFPLTLRVIAMALWTLGVFASLYAGYLKPELRVTCSNLSSVINGMATILMFVFIDPQVSVMTDDVIEGRTSDGRFRRAITSLLGARLAGTVLAQFLLLPSADIITRIAEVI